MSFCEFFCCYLSPLPPLLFPFTKRLRLMTITTFETMIMKITPSNDVKKQSKNENVSKIMVNEQFFLTIGSRHEETQNEVLKKSEESRERKQKRMQKMNSKRMFVGDVQYFREGGLRAVRLCDTPYNFFCRNRIIKALQTSFMNDPKPTAPVVKFCFSFIFFLIQKIKVQAQQSE